MAIRDDKKTPDFDNAVLSAVGEGGDQGGNNQQPQNDQDSGGGGDNRQPTQNDPQQQQPNKDAFDDVIARTDRADPNAQQQPDPNKQKKPDQQQQQQGRKIVDDNGQDVPPGAAQRHFFARKTAEKALGTARSENATLKGQLQAFSQLHQTMQSSGLTAQEQATSLSLGAALKKDPVGAVKQLLTELKSAGINVDGAMSVSGIDTSAIATLVRNELAPLRERFNNEQKQQEHESQIASDVNEFFEEYPDARVHTNDLNALLQRFPDWSLDKAWAELRVGAVKAGLDLNQPLRPQIAAKRGTNQPANGGARVPMLSNGRGGVQPQPQQPTKSYGHNAEIRDMVRDSLAEAGVDVSRIG